MTNGGYDGGVTDWDRAGQGLDSPSRADAHADTTFQALRQERHRRQPTASRKITKVPRKRALLLKSS